MAVGLVERLADMVSVSRIRVKASNPDPAPDWRSVEIWGLVLLWSAVCWWRSFQFRHPFIEFRDFL